MLMALFYIIGQENVRPVWNRYYDNVEGIIFVLDSSCTTEEFTTVKEELHKVLGHASLKGLPILILASYQDQSTARKTDQVLSIINIQFFWM